jgi:cytochrome c5
MNGFRPVAWAGIGIIGAALLWQPASAQRRERSGAEVVEIACANCHARGENGAPRIGDNAAWAKRTSLGLTALTEHALKGIRNMPAHGGNASLSDIEIERAITTMVNRSGGNWVEPLGGATPAVLRSSEQIVQSQCAKCHQEGVDGAPKIGDRGAWIPRLAKGLDHLVKSAVHGRGHMPARGGSPDLSDREIEGAVVYMFNYGIVMPPAAPAPAAARADPYHQLVNGADVFLGVVLADAIAASQRQGAAPVGKGYYHVNISLFDAQTKRAITDAQVKVKVADTVGAETKTLDIIASNNTISYGGYFRMSGPGAYTITAQIQRPGARSTEAKFQYKVR